MRRYEFEEDRPANSIEQVTRSLSALESQIRKRVETQEIRNSVLRSEVSYLRQMRSSNDGTTEKGCLPSDGMRSVLTAKEGKQQQQTTATADLSFMNTHQRDSRPYTTAFELSVLSQRPDVPHEKEKDEQPLTSMYQRTHQPVKNKLESAREPKHPVSRPRNLSAKKNELLSKGYPTVHKVIKPLQSGNIMGPVIPIPPTNPWLKNTKIPLRFRQ